jgi:hypothetical protein
MNLQVTAVVTCEAAGPWGLITTIEGIMATQAEKSVSGFLDFCAPAHTMPYISPRSLVQAGTSLGPHRMWAAGAEAQQPRISCRLL